MTDSKPTLAHGDEYIVIYSGGPSDGQTDRRISTDGSWDDSLTVLASEGGIESMMNYDATSWREVGGVYHVTYTFDPGDSDELEDPIDRD
ncbi:oligoribonuclease [Salinibacterium sp. dk2585]|uniref:oligoribonuclease n=1 Tax=unclassified Salinibacterium TaxID=2632331 RepID=UPI0011C245B1|nr:MULTISPECIES: oligoribonuclease [unclassified Salinibacterium]QEE61508.1 oligoribonuclease [Salinibacterium sp. dk2585]TXK52523.1 oligoribonuclease [Salinibacterium sp. dk5596]